MPLLKSITISSFLYVQFLNALISLRSIFNAIWNLFFYDTQKEVIHLAPISDDDQKLAEKEEMLNDNGHFDMANLSLRKMDY